MTPNYLADCSDDIVALYRNVESEVVNDMAKRIAKVGKITSTTEFQIMQMQESGLVYNDIVKRIAKANGVTQKSIKTLFNDAGIKSLKFDDDIYTQAGLNPLPIKQSESLLQILSAGVQKNSASIKNITMTTALAGQNAFIQASDIAYQGISSGAFTYQQAISNAVSKMSKEGLQTIDYKNNRKMNVESAVRRTVLTGINQTASQLQMARAEEMGATDFEVTAHGGARKEHASWQGKVWSKRDLYGICGLGTAGGLCGVNCRHSYYPYYKGVSERAYSDSELKSLNEDYVEYNGKKMTYYDGTQKLRGIERNIRTYKREANALEMAGVDNSLARSKIREWQSIGREFTKQTGIKRDYFREKVIKLEKPKTPITAIEKPKPKPIIPPTREEQAKAISENIKSKGFWNRGSHEENIQLGELYLKDYKEFMKNEEFENLYITKSKFDKAKKDLELSEQKIRELNSKGSQVRRNLSTLEEVGGQEALDKAEREIQAIYRHQAEVLNPAIYDTRVAYENAKREVSYKHSNGEGGYKYDNMYKFRTFMRKNNVEMLSPSEIDLSKFFKNSNVFNESTVECIQECLAVYPKKMLDELSKWEPIELELNVKRGYFSNSKQKIAVSGDLEKYSVKEFLADGQETLIHEVGHWIDSRDYGRPAKEFLEYRTKGEDATWLGGNYEQHEIGKRDKFSDVYMGKVYNSMYDTEINSMGFTSLILNPSTLELDEEYKSFILGILFNMGV